MSNYLIHYASKYYDPVKAHEYYEEHKKLKGRKSTSTLNEEGKYAAEYLKEQINAQRDSAISSEKSNKESKLDSAKTQNTNSISNYTSRVNTSIERLKSKLKNMSSAEKARNSEAINNQIAKLKTQNQEQKARLNAAYNKKKETINSDYTTTVADLKSQYENLYLDELDKLKTDPSLLKTSTSKSSSSSSDTTKKNTTEYVSNAYKYQKKNKTSKKDERVENHGYNK